MNSGGFSLGVPLKFNTDRVTGLLGMVGSTGMLSLPKIRGDRSSEMCDHLS